MTETAPETPAPKVDHVVLTRQRGEMVDCKVNDTVVNPNGKILRMGGTKYALDLVGQHTVGDKVYDVVDDED